MKYILPPYRLRGVYDGQGMAKLLVVQELGVHGIRYGSVTDSGASKAKFRADILSTANVSAAQDSDAGLYPSSRSLILSSLQYFDGCH